MSDPRDREREDTGRPTLTRVQRLLRGDWSAYVKAEQRYTIYGTTLPDGKRVEPIDPHPAMTEWDWGLLRHDIHVLFHRASAREQALELADSLISNADRDSRSEVWKSVADSYSALRREASQ